MRRLPQSERDNICKPSGSAFGTMSLQHYCSLLLSIPTFLCCLVLLIVSWTRGFPGQYNCNIAVNHNLWHLIVGMRSYPLSLSVLLVLFGSLSWTLGQAQLPSCAVSIYPSPILFPFDLGVFCSSKVCDTDSAPNRYPAMMKPYGCPDVRMMILLANAVQRVKLQWFKAP
jgi:hypothetical protein